MANTLPSNPNSSPTIQHEYPFAFAPDVLRTHEKDAYLTQNLSGQASSILQSLLGVRFSHRHSTTTNRLVELLYLSLTTLLGNRTLGEEYCDVIQVEDDTRRLVGLARRVGYVASVVLAPWILERILPVLRRKVRTKLERNIRRAGVVGEERKEDQMKNGEKESRLAAFRFQRYILQHLDAITSLTPVHALSLAMFYFTGSYYHLSKRLFGLRYIFTRRIQANEERAGYEFLGVLLVLQLLVQSTLHVRETILQRTSSGEASEKSAVFQSLTSSAQADSHRRGDQVNATLAEPEDLLLQHPEEEPYPPSFPPNSLSQTIQTPILDYPRYHLASTTQSMLWIPAGQQSKCTLCLDPLRDPSVTTCGHVFCWTCIQDWVQEKPECPLCRQTILPQKVLPLRS